MSQNIQQVVENLIENLKAKGITVENAAILNLGKASGQSASATATGPFPSEEAFKRAIEKIAGKFGPGAFKGQAPPAFAPVNEAAQEEPQKSDEICTCPNCLNFENFEQVYGAKQPAAFDYGEVTLGGKVFLMKYYKGYYGEQIMTTEKEFSVDPTWTPERIQEEFRLATLNKEYDKAQVLLTTLKNFKN